MKRSWKVPKGPPVQLTDEERALAEDIRQRLTTILTSLRQHAKINPKDIDVMGAQAHKLHMSLKGHGHEPQHHKYMLKNRGVPPTDPEFYNHVHPVEDLLGFLANQNANDNPVDLTIGQSFSFPIYSRRWGHIDSYKVTRTSSGWTFHHMQDVAAGRDARVGGKSGTGLFELLDHDSINYPEELPGYFEWLWEQAADRGLDAGEVQSALTDLADWVSLCEKNSPQGVFESFK